MFNILKQGLYDYPLIKSKLQNLATKKIPYTIILGDKERDENLISYRLHGSNETNSMNKDEFIKYLKGQINDKK